MYMKSLPMIAATAAVATTPAMAHDDRAIEFPATLDGGVILAADLHTHSVFSDGEVWPSIRVEEARRDGLELLAVTEHLEGQPKRDDIPHPDRNRSFEVAVESLIRSGTTGLFVINGAEVTRQQPYGHINAVFLDDANALLTDKAEDALMAAREQDAFVFVNHPNWIPQMPDGIARLSEEQLDLIDKGLIQGIEVVNGTLDGHSEEALELAFEHDLTVLGTSDIHGLVDWTHDAGHGGHRPMSLILAEEHSPEAMKKALFDGNTVAWSYDDLMGKAENVEKVVRACLSLKAAPYPARTTVLPVDIINKCPVNFTLRNTSAQTFQNVSDVVRVERDKQFTLQVRTGAEPLSEIDLTFEVMNTQIGSRKSLELTFSTHIPD